jgi:hypothetical protein
MPGMLSSMTRHRSGGARIRFDLRFKVTGRTAAEFGFHDQPRLAVGYAEKTIEHLIGRDRIAVARQHLRMRAA